MSAWADFLEARQRVIHEWLADSRDPSEIADTLSMMRVRGYEMEPDADQVRLIGMTPLSAPAPDRALAEAVEAEREACARIVCYRCRRAETPVLKEMGGEPEWYHPMTTALDGAFYGEPENHCFDPCRASPIWKRASVAALPPAPPVGEGT